MGSSCYDLMRLKTDVQGRLSLPLEGKSKCGLGQDGQSWVHKSALKSLRALGPFQRAQSCPSPPHHHPRPPEPGG